MTENRKVRVADSVRGFSLPRYDEIPNVGLYLEQTAKYISEYLDCLGDFALTRSMISNYVKKKIIDNPIKKQYYREQIIYLFFIAMAKSVLSLEDIRLMIHMQKMTYSGEEAYNYFVRELENTLKIVFSGSNDFKDVGEQKSSEKTMLRNTVIAISHKVYLDVCFAQAREAQEEK